MNINNIPEAGTQINLNKPEIKLNLDWKAGCEPNGI